MRLAVIFILLLSILLLATAPAFAEQITIKFSHSVGEDKPKRKATEYFKRLVEQRSDNRVHVVIDPAEKADNDQKELEALKANSIQMVAPSFSSLRIIEPQLQLFDLPFLFQDSSHLHRAIDGKVGSRLLSRATHDGLVALAFWDNGFKQLTANQKLASPQDAAGLKVRIMGSGAFETLLKELGASPKRIPHAQAYVALEEELVDGQENTLSNIYTQELYKVQSDLTISNHGYLGYMVLTNSSFWSRLPEDLKVIIQGAIKGAAEYTREMADQTSHDALKKIRAVGNIKVHILSTAERKAWLTLARKTYLQYQAVIGKDLIYATQETDLR